VQASLGALSLPIARADASSSYCSPSRCTWAMIFW
jgi:hypothetical protein